LEAIADARPGYRPQAEGGGPINVVRFGRNSLNEDGTPNTSPVNAPAAPGSKTAALAGQPHRGRQNKGTAQPNEGDQPLLSQDEANNPGQGRNVQKGQQAGMQEKQQRSGQQSAPQQEDNAEAPPRPNVGPNGPSIKYIVLNGKKQWVMADKDGNAVPYLAQ
jgi:hypothetical protein